jgi:hypothetical protein
MRWACVRDATGRDCNWVSVRSSGRIVPGQAGSWDKYQHMSMACAVIHPDTEKAMEYVDVMKIPTLKPLLQRGLGNECGRLFQSLRNIKVTKTCFFIELKNLPKERNITNGKIVCDYKLHKKEKERVRITVEDGRLEYSGEMATSAADLATFKILINSNLSTEEA